MEESDESGWRVCQHPTCVADVLLISRAADFLCSLLLNTNSCEMGCREGYLSRNVELALNGVSKVAYSQDCPL